MSEGRDAWDGILGPGEEILWQGRPAKGLALDLKTAKEFLPGAAAVCLAIFWMRATRDAESGLQAMGFVFFLAGLYQLGAAPFLRGYLRRACTFYTLTNRRAFVAVDHPFAGKSLKSYAIGPETLLDFQPGAYASIYFATEFIERHESTETRRVGFENLHDGEAVFGLLSGVQQGTLS